MSYSRYTNYGDGTDHEYGQDGQCEPSTVPRPTGMCTRFAMNVPPNMPYINPQTGVRRKAVFPEMDFRGAGYTDVDTEVEDDFFQAEDDCRQEMIGKAHRSPMPWGGRFSSPRNMQLDSVHRLETLIKEENEEIGRAQKYMRHANVNTIPKSQGFSALASKYRNRAMINKTTVVDTDNLDPDMAASMMATEEQGQVLKHIPPAALFQRLFPEDNRKATIQIRGASKYHRDHVVPERGALRHGDYLMNDVDAGIVPFGDLVQEDVHRDEKLPSALFRPGDTCPDGICDSPSKKKADIQVKVLANDDEQVEITWTGKKEGVNGYQLYYAPVTPNEKKGTPEWKSMYVSTPKYDMKWSSLGSHAEAVHFAVSPIIGNKPPPETPSKDAGKLDVQKPKTRGKSFSVTRSTPKTIEPIDNIHMTNVAGGVELEWQTPVNGREGAFIEYKSTAHTKMQYKATRENHAFLPVPENQGKLYVSLQPRTSGSESAPIVELLWDTKLGQIVTMQVNEQEDDAKRFYTVSSLPPLTGNFIQLRGSQPPPWFPGYFTVQPGIPEVMALDEPHEALENAWAAMSPSQVKSPHGNYLLGKP